jgi:magnesium-transporting ATPase (P-type)
MIFGTYTTWFDSPITPWSTLGTLLIVVIIAMTKEGLEDWKRHRADHATNMQITHSFRRSNAQSLNPILQDLHWNDVVVGDIVKIFNNENVPADMILLGSSESFGNAYVETSNIDGETNLKLKCSVIDSNGNSLWNENALTSSMEFSNFSIYCKCDPPNASILRFRGLVSNYQEEIPVDEKSLLLRGCKLKNTAWAVGLLVYTGRESKVVMNSRSTPSKLSLLEKTMNSLVFFVFILQMLLSLVSFMSYLIWIYAYKDNIPYLCIEASSAASSILSGLCESATQYSNGGYLVTFFILYNNFIPISLYVTIEVCNYLQAFFIDNDKLMYDDISNNAAMARTSNMNSDLGMVQYIFSDKTGTLTENIMKFQKLSFRGLVYAVDSKPHEINLSDLRTNQKDDPFQSLLGYVLSVCHTVVIESLTREVRAESPDEEALLIAGREIGWIFEDREPGKVLIRQGNNIVQVQLLATIPFTSARKRMSVVIRTTEGKLLLLTKGADNVMFDLAASDIPVQSHLNISARDVLLRDLQKFSFEGLRTLVLAYKELSEESFIAFQRMWTEAGLGEDREDLRSQAAALVENNLMILGATAIEDKLQKDVPETIDFILRSGIKLWVLTGDKVETAINIGYSAKLITRDMIVIRMQYGSDHSIVKRKLHLLVRKLTSLTVAREQLKAGYSWCDLSSVWDILWLKSKNDKFEDTSTLDDEEVLPLLDRGPELSTLSSDRLALVVDGSTLLSIIGDKECEDLFLTITAASKTVIACRVSPEQKRLLVKLVKTKAETRPLTLSIGDGANDVPMIQEAAIGVGISGREGRQAVNNADFAISQFRFLKRLLFVHGRWNYRRTSKVVLYSFYKNIVLALSMFYYTFFSGYSGQTMYESNIYGLYNIVLSLSVVAFGIFDRDVAASVLLSEPSHYSPGRNRTDLNWTAIFLEFLQAIFDSCILFFIPYISFYDSMDAGEANGKQTGIWLYGFVVYEIILVAMMIRIGIISYSWTWIWYLFFIGSLGVFVGFCLAYQYIYSYAYDFYGITNKAMNSDRFWAILFVVCFMSASFKIAWDLVVDLLLTSKEDHAKEEDLRKNRQISWASLDRWGDSISDSDKQVLGVVNTSKDRMSSYNFDHVTTSLGPGASVQRFLEDAKKSFAHVFSYSASKKQ